MNGNTNTKDDSQLGSEVSQARIPVKISSDRLTATVCLPQMTGSESMPITSEEILQELQRAGVTYGLKDDVIAKLPQEGPFDEIVIVAEGDPPVAGRDAQITCMFDVAPDHSPKADKSGRIDYHEVNFIQGVKKGSVLMKRTLPTSGEPGRGVDGNELSAQAGKDRLLQKGTNTVISEDGLELIADVSGAIVFTRGNQVSVRDIVTVAENVDFSTGNIHSPGSIRVNGDVRAGFKVHADGDVEIHGAVEDAEVISSGNILIKSGFTGRGEGLVKAEGNVTVQHVEGQHIIAGHDIKIGGDALNARLEAGSKVFTTAPEGRICGGVVIAEEEIKAANLGNDAWTLTTLKVAGDENLRQELQEVEDEIERLGEDEKRVKKAIYGLVRLELNGSLPDEQKAALDKLRQFSKELPTNLKGLEDIKAKLTAEIESLLDARIIATKTLYPGVKAQFGIVYHDVKEERGPTSMCCYSGRVVMDPYQEEAQ